MRNETFNSLLDDIKELHNAKNHDYAQDGNPYSNFEFAALIVREFTDPVDQVFATMIGVKLARLGQLMGHGKVPNNESITDSLRDLTTYCGIWTAYRTPKEAGKELHFAECPVMDGGQCTCVTPLTGSDTSITNLADLLARRNG